MAGQVIQTNKNEICSKVTCIPVAHPSTLIKKSSYADIVKAKLDSGASRHYLRSEDRRVLVNIRPLLNGPHVILPDQSTIQAKESGQLPLPHVSTHAKEAKVFQDLKSSSLLSLGQLCDDGCKAILDKEKVTVTKGKNIVLKGVRNPRDGLWDVSLPVPDTMQMNIIIEKNKSKKELAQYLHACCYSPSISTLIRAIKNNHLATWPGINDINFTKHLPQSEATSKGHLDQEQAGLQSTKYKHTVESSETPDTDFFPSRQSTVMRTNDCCAIVVPFQETTKAYMDSTGRFPHKSTRGNEYVMVVYDYDSNAILVEALKNRTAGEMTRSWTTIQNRLSLNGTAPNLYILDNEISGEFKKALKKYKVDFQLVPPHIHRANAAERAIRTFKNHFIAGLCSVHPAFPMCEWDRLLFQAELTLNLLRSARSNPNLSAYAFLFGQFDFNKTPLAPPGSKLQVHLKPSTRASWDPHSEHGWYIGPAMDHYRCFKCFIPSTNKLRHCDTVDFFPHNIPIPKYKPEDYIHKAINDILAALQTKKVLPGFTLADNTSAAILEVAKLLGRSVPPPTFVEPISPSLPPNVIFKKQAPTVSLPRVTVAKVPRVKEKRSASKISLRNRRLNLGQYLGAARRFRSGTNYKHFAATRLLAQHIFQHKVNHIYNEHGKKETMESLLRGENKVLWDRSLSNEFGRLAQGNKYGVVATDTIEFIFSHEVPSNKGVTYASFVCDYRPLKSEPYRVRIVVGGDKLSYAEDAASPATGLVESKLLINSTISDAKKNARFLSADLKDHFLASPMRNPEFMKIHISKFPQDIIEQYNLREKMDSKGFVYIKIKKGMYGLKQASILAYEHLVRLLAPHGYYPEPHCVGIWSHKTRPTKFCLCVDDFGVKYFSKDDADHLLNSLRQTYKISVDWTGRNYCGLTMDWNYENGFVDISMPNYVPKALHRFQHPPPSKPQYSPHKWLAPIYGAKQQFATSDNSDLLDKKGTQRVQSVAGTFLYYARAVDPTMLPALTEISSSQSAPSQHTKQACDMLMDYANTYPNAKIRYYASGMILHIDSDAAYLVMKNARSRIAGHYFLGDLPPRPPALPNPASTNGPIHTVCRRLRNVVSSAAEAETGGVFHNSQEGIPIRRALEALGHRQPPDGTPFKLDNAVSHGFINSNIKMKKSKTWDMRWHWLRDKETLKVYRYYWAKGSLNNADYFSKHHAPQYHRDIRSTFVLKGNLIREMLSYLTKSLTVP